MIDEKIVKSSGDQIDGNFDGTVLEARPGEHIMDDELIIVNDLRETRSLLFQERH